MVELGQWGIGPVSNGRDGHSQLLAMTHPGEETRRGLVERGGPLVK
jgi:hypothetical protein